MDAVTVKRPILQIPPNNWRIWFRGDVKGRGGGYIDVTADQVRIYRGRAKVVKVERVEA